MSDDIRVVRLANRKTKNSAKGWKNGWRNQRDTYMKRRREVRSHKSGQAAEKAKKWQFYETMGFLEEFVKESSTESNVPACEVTPEEEADEDDSGCSAESSSEVSELAPVVLESAPKSPVPEPAQKKPRGNRKPGKSGIEDAIKDLIAHNQDKWEQLDITDPTPDADDLFFQSCAQKIKLLNTQFRSYLRMQITQLFFNAENPHLIPVPIMPLPCHIALTEEVTMLASLNSATVDNQFNTPI